MSGKAEMTQIKTGQAPNIPWWRIQNMSDEEIEKYNDSFMMIERLIERALQPNVYEKEIWNAAIEAAAKIIDDCNREGPYNAIGGARRIRELKNEHEKQNTLSLLAAIR